MNEAEAEEYTEALSQVLGGGWRQILLAKKLGVPETLGMTVKEWVSTRLGGYIRHSLEERQEASRELVNGEGLSNRQAAEVIGVNEKTVRRDVTAANAADQSEASAEETVANAANAAEETVDNAENSEGQPEDVELYNVLVIDPPWPMKKIERAQKLSVPIPPEISKKILRTGNVGRPTRFCRFSRRICARNRVFVREWVRYASTPSPVSDARKGTSNAGDQRSFARKLG